MCSLLCHTVGPLPGDVLGRIDLLASLAAEDTDKSTDRMGLPRGRFHDLGQRRAPGAFHHGYDRGLLVAAMRVLNSTLPGRHTLVRALLLFRSLCSLAGFPGP
jgi:hypothetical protein